MPKMVCVKCSRVLRIKKNSVWTQENVDGDGVPYQLYNFDKWVCPKCDTEILAGHGQSVHDGSPYFEKYKKEVEIEFW